MVRDLVVQTDGTSTWKDEDEFAALRERGYFSVEVLEELDRAREEVADNGQLLLWVLGLEPVFDLEIREDTPRRSPTEWLAFSCQSVKGVGVLPPAL